MASPALYERAEQLATLPRAECEAALVALAEESQHDSDRMGDLLDLVLLVDDLTRGREPRRQDHG